MLEPQGSLVSYSLRLALGQQTWLHQFKMPCLMGFPWLYFVVKCQLRPLGPMLFKKLTFSGSQEVSRIRLQYFSSRIALPALSFPSVGILPDSTFGTTKLISTSKACTKWNTMVRTVAELPKRILEAFEIGQTLQHLCAEDYTYSSSYHWAPWTCLDRLAVRTCSSNG